MSNKNKLYNEAAELRMRELCDVGLCERYGESVPEEVSARLEAELAIICGRGHFAPFLLAYEIARFFREQDAPYIARAFAGNSLTAFLLRISSANPLPPHYYCPQCGFTNFSPKSSARCGFDLTDVPRCPKCNEQLIGDGHDLSFEIFAGADGSRLTGFNIGVPMELYDEVSQRLRELLDNDELLCSEDNGNYEEFAIPEIERNSTVLIVGESLLSLADRLQYLTNVSNPIVPFEELDYEKFFECYQYDVPAFNYLFKNTSLPLPKKFSDLVRLFGLLSNKDVFEGRLSEPEGAIAHCDDVFEELLRHGVSKETALRAMDMTRHGNALELSDKELAELRSCAVSEEFINSMMKTDCLLPRAHDTEAAIKLAKLMWYKLHFPSDFAQARRDVR